MSVRSWDQCVDLGSGRGRAAPEAAASIRRIDAELGRLADINEAWRSPEQANANRARWLAYERHLNGGPYAPAAPYALGADASVHCEGYAADSDDWYNTAAAAVWRRNGWRQTARYPGTARDEPWHGEYRREWDENYGSGFAAGGNATPFEEDFMATMSDDEKKALLKAAEDMAWLRARSEDSFFPNFNELKRLGYETMAWFTGTVAPTLTIIRAAVDANSVQLSEVDQRTIAEFKRGHDEILARLAELGEAEVPKL